MINLAWAVHDRRIVVEQSCSEGDRLMSYRYDYFPRLVMMMMMEGARNTLC